jgi:hypothetical protein
MCNDSNGFFPGDNLECDSVSQQQDFSLLMSLVVTLISVVMSNVLGNPSAL